MRVLQALWRFLVGDDPLVAAGVAVAIGVTAILAAAGIAAWWRDRALPRRRSELAL